MKLGVPATIFLPSVTSPAKAERIGRYGAKLVVGGDRYADALAASEAFVAQSGTLPVHAFDQAETLLGQGSVGPETEAALPHIETPLVEIGSAADRARRCQYGSVMEGGASIK